MPQEWRGHNFEDTRMCLCFGCRRFYVQNTCKIAAVEPHTIRRTLPDCCESTIEIQNFWLSYAKTEAQNHSEELVPGLRRERDSGQRVASCYCRTSFVSLCESKIRVNTRLLELNPQRETADPVEQASSQDMPDVTWVVVMVPFWVP